MGQRLINEIGNKYGFLTVLSVTKDKNGHTAWLCQCDCGNTKIVRGSDLRTGKITSCGRGCPLRKKRNGVVIDETGHHYGRLTVLCEDEQAQSTKKKWICQCSCGNLTSVQGSDLRSGRVLSCGCYGRENNSKLHFKNELGNRYGRLTVVSLVTKHPKAIWHCKCDCGNYVDVRGIDLRSGNTKSCGCLISWYEELIAEYLTELNVNFKRQYTFVDLFSENNKPLRFDFAILSKQNSLLGLIEYNGIQHYEPVPGWGGLPALKQRQLYDTMKINYAKDHNIPLLILNKNNTNLKEDIKKFTEEINE